MFSGDQKVWFILESGKTGSPQALRRRFLKKVSNQIKEISKLQASPFSMCDWSIQEKWRKVTKDIRKTSGNKNSRSKGDCEGINSFNGEIYANLHQNNVCQPLKFQITQKQYWFQQDGAPCHCISQFEVFGIEISWKGYQPAQLISLVSP